MSSEPSSTSKRNINGKLIVIGVLALLLLVFTLVNTHEVNVDFVVTSVNASMIVVIAVAAGVGFALGFLFALHRANRDSS